jgi:hypothetical protein
LKISLNNNGIIEVMNADTSTKRITCLVCGYTWDVEIPKGYITRIDEETGYPEVINETTDEFITFTCPICGATMDRLRWR